jgi:hypothetical protein
MDVPFKFGLSGELLHPGRARVGLHPVQRPRATVPLVGDLLPLRGMLLTE